jgi:nucleotide-binding universal stress UspA family protein
MTAFASILCAIDFSSLALRVLRHAAGVAGACGGRLTIFTVTDLDVRRAETTVAALLRDVVPQGALYVGQPEIEVVRVTMGRPADAVLEHARRGFDLIVAGTHSKSGLSRWLLGSTSAAIMAESQCPVLLVPPGRLEIVSLAPEAARLVPSTVLAAIDLAEQNARQLALAGEMAALARQPLVLMTVAAAGVSDAEAEAALRSRGETLGTGAVDRVMVARGRVPDAIDEAAAATHAGLVVMGLRGRGFDVPGEIASAVLNTKDAVVLAVPLSGPSTAVDSTRSRRPAS